jgi:hypothetical protein
MTADPEILVGRRAFTEAQHLLAGVPLLAVPMPLRVGWYDTSVDPERGSFAVVAEEGEHQGLIGEIISVEFQGRSVSAYVLGARSITSDIALQRRAFMAIASPSAGSVHAQVQVLA